MRRRMADNIFARTHSLQRPDPGQALPILIQDKSFAGLLLSGDGS